MALENEYCIIMHNMTHVPYFIFTEFTTMNGHQHVFYKITSSAINFEIKAPGNACIGLAKAIRPEWDYLVSLFLNEF